MLRIVRGRETVTGFQHAFARAGHAHAGVLVSLSLCVPDPRRRGGREWAVGDARATRGSEVPRSPTG
jgi:hypothetical protein